MMEISMAAGLNPYLVILLMLFVGLALGLGVSRISFWLGPKNPNTAKRQAYECGLPSKTSADHRFSVKFYLTAILFILFDIETIFMYLWAVVFDSLGWFGIVEIGIFIFTLGVGYIYVLKRGALRWDTL